MSSISRVRAQELVDIGARGAKRLLEIVRDPARYVNTALLMRVMAETLQAPLRELTDTHNYTAWRDAFDPHLARLLADAW